MKTKKKLSAKAQRVEEAVDFLLPMAAWMADVAFIIQMKTVAPLVRVFHAAPRRIVCPKCREVLDKKSFGVRVMSRRADGVPTVQMQSYCERCR